MDRIDCEARTFQDGDADLGKPPYMFVTTGLNDIKERLSVAYLAAVTARAGYQISHLSIDKQSIDATVRPITGRKLSVDFQLKATSAECIGDLHVIFDLSVNNYDHLRDTKCTALHYLMVLVLPPKRGKLATTG